MKRNTTEKNNICVFEIRINTDAELLMGLLSHFSIDV